MVSKSSIGAGGKSKSEELRDVKALLDDGIIDDDEFKQMKKEILGKYADISHQNEKELIGGAQCGTVLQASLRRTLEDVRGLAALGSNVRICKGAYVEPAVMIIKAKTVYATQ